MSILTLSLGAAEPLKLLSCLLTSFKCLRHGLGEGLVSPEAIELLSLNGRAQQGLVSVLGVDVDE